MSAKPPVLVDGSDDDETTVHESGGSSAGPTNPTDDVPNWPNLADWRAGLLI